MDPLLGRPANLDIRPNCADSLRATDDRAKGDIFLTRRFFQFGTVGAEVKVKPYGLLDIGRAQDSLTKGGISIVNVNPFTHSS